MSENRQLDFAEAIREAIRQEMKRDKTVFVLGEDVGNLEASSVARKDYRKNLAKTESAIHQSPKPPLSERR